MRVTKITLFSAFMAAESPFGCEKFWGINPNVFYSINQTFGCLSINTCLIQLQHEQVKEQPMTQYQVCSTLKRWLSNFLPSEPFLHRDHFLPRSSQKQLDMQLDRHADINFHGFSICTFILSSCMSIMSGAYYGFQNQAAKKVGQRMGLLIHLHELKSTSSCCTPAGQVGASNMSQDTLCTIKGPYWDQNPSFCQNAFENSYIFYLTFSPRSSECCM